MNLVDLDLAKLEGFTPKRPPAIDSSMLSDFVACPWMFYARHILGASLRGPEAISLLYGSFWHELMEAFIVEETNDRGIEAAAAYHEENQELLLFYEEKKNRTRGRVWIDFLTYVEKFGKIDRANELISAEQTFDLFLTDDLRWAGKIDRVFKRGGKGYVMDHKSTTFMHPYYFSSHELGFQIRGYVWAAQQLLPGLDVSNALLDVYHITKNGPKNPADAFKRHPFFYHQAQIDEWKFEVIRWLEILHNLMDLHLDNPSAWRRNWTSCSDYGGCKLFTVCSTPPQNLNRNRMLAADFEEKRWDPIKQEES